MIFKDEVSIYVKAGNGGRGAVSFRREKYIPKGGPDGGDGGDGGNIIIRVNPHLRTLSHIHNNQKFRAKNGGDGMGALKHGANGEDTIIEVPPGTIVYEKNTMKKEADLVEDKEFIIIAKGGKGGKGNAYFKNPSNQAPRYAQKGLPGEEKELLLELKMIAHVGLVGYPNAGKSTLISKITNARPKVADYPFTTLQPNLGVMTVDDSFTSILIADIPGIIEKAHEGRGLGLEFLKHIERTKIILFVLDITDKPEEKLKILKEELKNYSETLYNREFLIALNKIDLIYQKEELEKVKGDFLKISKDTHLISALTGEGLKELKTAIYRKFLEQEKLDFLKPMS
ncbi:MAG: GTPase ObgE [Brevinematia bacterium]